MEGVDKRHQAHCVNGADGSKCNCKPSFRAWVWDPTKDRKIRKTFKSLHAAKSWRAATQTAVWHAKKEGLTDSPTVAEASKILPCGMADGTIRNRSGEVFKPSMIPSYKYGLKFIVAELGAYRLDELEPEAVQQMVDGWIEEGISPSTVKNRLMPLRVIYRWSRRRYKSVRMRPNPTRDLDIPAYNYKVGLVIEPGGLLTYIAALRDESVSLAAFWACAFLAGLRRGEILGLTEGTIRYEDHAIEVAASWDSITKQLVAPKSKAGVRSVPLPKLLAELLKEHEATLSGDSQFVFPSTRWTDRPVGSATMSKRASRVWAESGLKPIGLHEGRHLYASIAHAAGTEPKQLQKSMGHSTIGVTYDLYTHLLSSADEAAAKKLDDFLDGLK